MTVVIKGRKLASVDEGIGAGWVAALEAFNSEKRDRPSDDAALIESIEFYPMAKQDVAQLKPRAKPRLVKTEAEQV